MKRRQFLSGAIGAGVALGMSRQLLAGQGPAPGSKLKVLVLGGTGFIGPPTVRYAVERGHEVAIFTRGRSKSVVPGVEHLVGDRNDDLSALRGREWDVVLDNNARDYRWVKLSTEILKDNVRQYVFISTISAYAGEATGYEFLDEPYAGPRIDINSPLAQPPADFEMGEELPYGPTKALSEKIVQEAFPGRSTIVRPGFIVGPGDPSDRFTYWPVRIDRGGEVLVPGDGNDEVQVIDVRDLMEFTVRLAENGTAGVFNGVGIGSRLSMAEMVYGIRGRDDQQGPVHLGANPLPEGQRRSGVHRHADLDSGRPAVFRRQQPCPGGGPDVPAAGGDRRRYAGLAQDPAAGRAGEAAHRDRPRPGERGARGLACRQCLIAGATR